jgi:hypothetical protein
MEAENEITQLHLEIQYVPFPPILFDQVLNPLKKKLMVYVLNGDNREILEMAMETKPSLTEEYVVGEEEDDDNLTEPGTPPSDTTMFAMKKEKIT